ncbi:MAG TPA: hypothetical protein VH414_20770 [Lichenihabitans sp.]|jgi:predicted nucleic acid-binding protein|nr:hypothetical protein [Lichenihabitans sp.]
MMVALDANALDRKTTARGKLVDRFEQLVASGAVEVYIGPGVQAEVAHPATPGTILRGLPRTEPRPFRPLAAAEHLARIRVRAMVQGNARPGKHARDASHLSEAAEAGCRYFITYDGRILGKRDDLEGFALPATLRIVTIEEFLDRWTDAQPPVAKPG